jgi:ABC-type lipoprotein export system ATPase subunit
MISMNKKTNMSILVKSNFDKNNGSLLHNINNGIIKSGKKWDILKVILLNIFDALLLSSITYLNFKISKTLLDNNKDEFLKLQFCILIINCVKEITSSFKNYNMEKLKNNLKRFYKNHFINYLILNVDHEWLCNNNHDAIFSAIDKGTDSILGIITFFINSFCPILQALGNMIILYKYVNSSLFVILILLIIVFTTGTQILLWEYNKRSKVNLETSTLYQYNKFLVQTFLTSLLNGEGENTKEEIFDNEFKSIKLHYNIYSQVNFYYKNLQIFGNISIYLILIFIIKNENVSIISAFSIALLNTIDKMWWLFYMVNNVSRSTSEWCVLEKYLNSVIPIKTIKKEKLNKYDISKFNGEEFKDLKSKEYQIIGSSGSGKSTWMLKEAINLHKNFETDWIYLDQRMRIPTSNNVTIFDLLTKFITKNKYKSEKLEQKIIYWSKFLRLENIINLDNLNKSFKSPSGGEEKRIIILQKFLPILIRDKIVKVILSDEITSGLGDEDQKNVRELLEKLKNEYDITIINIDHHKYESKDLIKIGVKIINDKQKDDISENKLPEQVFKKSLLNKLVNFLSTRYKKIEKSEKSDKSEKVKKKFLPNSILKIIKDEEPNKDKKD